MTAFEDYIRAEIVRRPAVLTQTITGYAGNPNLSTDLIINGAPHSTFFLDANTGQLWQKMLQADPVSWNVLGAATATVGILHLYADGTSGDNTNDGRTVGTPKRTLSAVFALMPDVVKHYVCIHLTGNFGVSELAYLVGTVDAGVYVVIDGGADFTILDGPYTADIASTTSIGLSTAGWTSDEHAGYWVQILDGAAAGQTRLITEHDGTTLVPSCNFSTVPTGAQFQIVRPTTEISAANIRVQSSGEGNILVQRLYFTGSGYIYAQQPGTYLYMSHIVSNRSSGMPTYSGMSFIPSFQLFWMDPSTLVLQFANTVSQCGCSEVGTLLAVNLVNVEQAFIYGSYFKTASRIVRASNGVSIRLGTRFAALVQMYDVHASNYSSQIRNDSGYATTRFNSLELIDTNMGIGGGVDISDSPGHGIEANDSHLHLNGVVAGSGNTGAGVYAHSGSVVHTKDGSPPTLTGTVGDFAISDPTVEEGEWVDVEAGTKFAVAEEMTMIKKVA